MIRAICLLVFLCTIGLARAQAQSGVITLTVVDAETGEEVPGAVIEIVPKAHPDQKKYYTHCKCAASLMVHIPWP